jgi:multidrug efflux pump subunit AcrA (membrane-fusion protein)
MLNLKRRGAAFIAIALTSGCLTCSCGNQQAAAAVDLVDASQIKADSPKYKLASPQITDFTITASATGAAFLPVRDKLFFENAGASAAINARLNSFVKKGDVLAELTYDQDEAQTNIELTKISIDKENADYAAGEQEYENNLAIINARIDAETDAVQRQIDELRAEQLERNRRKAADAHNAAIESLSEDLERRQATTQPEQLTAPYDGFIDYVESRSPDAPVYAGEVLMEICDASVYELIFTGKTDDFGYNMPVRLTLKDKDKTVIDGVVVSDNADTDSSGNRSYIVRATDEIPDIQSLLQIGNRGGFTVDADSETIYGATVIPAEAVRLDENKSYVNIYEDGAVKKRYIKTGASDRISVQVLDGLSADDQVILN